MNASVHPTVSITTDGLPFDGATCPACDQIIPNDRLEEVKTRQAEHERERESLYALKAKSEREQLVSQFRQEKEDALAKARLISDVKEAAARAEERKAATAEIETKLSAATAALQAANAQAEELKRQLDTSATTTAQKVNDARADAIKHTEAALQPKLAASQLAAQAALDQVRALTERDEAARSQIAQLKLDALAAREEGKQSADTELRAQLTALSAEKQAAIDAKISAEQLVGTLRDSQEKAVSERVQEVREALEKSHRENFNAEQAKHFEDRLKIQNKLEDVQRQLDNKTSQELGEGAEVNLFEALKAEFPYDDIARVSRGVSGADIRHVVHHNGKDCGLILYDSKNHKAWRGEFVTKLRDDQIAAQADHAILSTIAFPQGTSQIHIQDNVIVVNPARAVALAKLVRQHVVQVHSLRLSNNDREEKALALYDFIASERFATLLTKLHVTTDSLAELDVKEQAAHKVTWHKRGQLINGVVKAEADLQSEIDRITGRIEGLETTEDEIPYGDTGASLQ